MKIVKHISIDVSANNVSSPIIAKQYDNDSRFLTVQLTNEGKPMTVKPDRVVTFNALREDGASNAFAGTVNDDGTVTVPITRWMLELDGTVKCDISVINSDEGKLTSSTFTIRVDAATHSGEDVSDDDNYDILVSLIAECSDATNAAKEATQTMNELIAQIKNGGVIGEIDSDNNIVLYGDIPEGAYQIKYEMADGSYAGAGTMDVVKVSNEIDLFTTYDPILNKRWSNSSKSWVDQAGCVGFELPLDKVVGKTTRFSGFLHQYGTATVTWYAVDDTGTRIQQFLDIFNVEGVVDEGDNTYSWVVPSVDGATNLMVFLPISTTTLTEADFANVSWTLTK